MPLERRNPLPAGRYWLQLPAEQEPSFGVWRKQNSRAVFTEKTTYDPEDGWTWFLFRLSAPVVWNTEAWGYPTTAAANIRSEADVMDLPEPQPSFIDTLESSAKGLQTGVWLVAGLVAVIALSRVFK